MKKRMTFGAIAIAVVFSVFCCLSITNTTHAAEKNVVDRWLLAMHYKCLTDYAASPISPEDNSEIRDLMYPSGKEGWEPLPSLDYFAGNIWDDSGGFTCRKVLEGDGGFSNDVNGIYQRTGTYNPNATWESAKGGEGMIEKLGYEPSSPSVDINIKERFFNGSNIGNTNTASESVTLHATQSAFGYTYDISGSDKFFNSFHDVELELNESKNELTIKYSPSLGMCSISRPSGGSVGADGNFAARRSVPLDGNIDTTINNITNAVRDINVTATCNSSAGNTISSLSSTYFLEVDSRASEYALNPNRTAAAQRSIGALTGASVNDAVGLSPDEYYSMYSYYLAHTPGYASNKITCQNDGNRVEVHLKAKASGNFTKYYLDPSGMDLNTSYQNMFVANNEVFFNNTTLRNIIDWLNSQNGGQADEIAAGDTCPTPDIGEQVSDNTVDNEKSCFDNSGSLGWIVCPIMKSASEAVQYLYSQVVQPLLQTNVSAFDQSAPTYKAWQIFQSIANVVFVVLFLVVILSQLTGIGIDNLGIKRILPKLIIAAVLVNLSYIICMLLVDVSNILGFGLYSFFDNLDSSGVNSAAGSTVGTWVASIGLVGAGAAGVAAIVINPAIILPILLGLISLLISILAMFVMLGVYRAGVILAVIVSPLAFVLYMLPNTKSVFDRWRKLFQGLLLLYPICGLVMGGGAFAGRVIGSISDDFWTSLAGALLSVIPFFFIPKILQNSMSAMGNIGAKISGIGRGLGGRATGAIANSEAVKDWQARSAAGVNRNGELTGRGRLLSKIALGKDGKARKNAFSRSLSRNLIRSNAAYQKREDEITKGAANLDPRRMEAHRISEEKAAEKEAMLAEMALINNATRNGDNEGDLYSMFDEARDNGNITRMRAIAEIAGRRKDSASRFAEKLKRDTIEGKYAVDGGEKMLRDLSKQIATGDNSKNYREGNATGFEFAARTNDGSNSDLNYADWISNDENVKNVVENYLNTPEGLSGQTKAVLRELSGSPVKDKQGNVLYSANINNDTKAALSRTADKYYQNHESGNGVYYDDKEKDMQTLRGLSRNNGQSQSATPNPNRAQPDQSFYVQNSSSGTQSSIVTPGTKEYNQAADDLKKNNS